MWSGPVTDDIIISDNTIHITDICTYNDYPLMKLKKMIRFIGEHLIEDTSMDFSTFKSLNLRSLQLTYLPSNFASQMSNLTFLDVSNNKLEELPYSFRELTKLEHLVADNNILAVVPNSIGQLKHLRILSLAHNRLQQLPECFGCLHNLENLNLSNNSFQNLPVSCTMFNKLTVLDISNNKLTSIPECVIHGIKNLHKLDISGNQKIIMNEAPASIHLTTFIAENNGVCKFFPRWILDIKYNQLKTINLNNTKFCHFPSSKEQVALQITNLSIRQSNLFDSSIEYLLSNMVKLKVLDLSNIKQNTSSGNNFWNIPIENMKVCNTLREMNVSRTGLPWLSPNIGKFCNLMKFDLSYNPLTWLPEEITMLQNLRILRIDYSKIIELPKSMEKLENLEELWASGNEISQIPCSLFKLKNLRLLDLYDNNISEVSDKISEMNHLQQVDLDNNFCDVSSYLIQGNSYKDLKKALRDNVNCFNKYRLNGAKVETDDIDEVNQNTDTFHHMRSWSDNSSTEEDLSEESENSDTEKENQSYKIPEENWDLSLNDDDEFDPNDIGMFRKTEKQSACYLSISAHSNFYCPADNLVKPVKEIMAERNIIKIVKVEDGQFDDA